MKTILLIEDDYLDVESVRRTLKKSNINHILHVSHNGTDAINMLTRDDNKVVPDIILMDINMPKMNGLEFIQIVKSYHGLRDIKLFVISTSTEEYDKISTQHLGVEGYIVKPLDLKMVSNPDVAKLLNELA